MYFAQEPLFEHSISGVGNLPSHVLTIHFNCCFQLILAVISFASVLMTWKFPETKGEKMFSTIEEAEGHYKKQKGKKIL